MFAKLSKMLKIHKFAASSKLKDGTDIFIDGDLSEGTKIYVVTSDGNLPLPDGEYELEDGTKITVAEGIITDVSENDGEEEESVSAEEESKKGEEEELSFDSLDGIKNSIVSVSEQVSQLIEKIETVEKMNNELTESNKKIDEKLKGFEDLKTKNEEFSNQIQEFKDQLETIPGAEKIKKRVENENSKIPNKRLQILRDYKG